MAEQKKEEIVFNGQVVNPETIITIEDGLIGFSDYTRYIITDLEGEENAAFRWLQCLDNHDIGFLITDPAIFFTDYQPNVVKEELEELKLKKNDEKVTIVILNFNREQQFLAANLRSPIIVNSRTKLAKQVILSDSNYPTREYIFKKE